MGNVLEVFDVSKSFGGIHALEGCSLQVEQGSITGLIGPNGSGKTTLFNAITGYERIDAGSIHLPGEIIVTKDRPIAPDKVFRTGLGRTFQLTRIFPRLSVIENMHVATQRKGLGSFFSRWSTGQEQRRAVELLHFVGLDDLQEHLAGELSYGQRKLLEFALILIADPKIILLDEPAGGVNPSMINHIGERIRVLNQEQGITFLIVEHNMEFVMGICDKITVFHRGTNIAEGSPGEVRNNPAVLEAYLGD
ncbi:ABC transporter ATP-binding protein [Tengunoibacter tsumagoiensis]|uniref:ABC transporter ATP-binding protein n=1 Tax=Tengunoibacter tsumagoiensis TaxID=2014871 RepID=A0A402A416_9CHLR|nr:ABC transporter ATP-binding protein [Tengunoibacter tsumagoiensis]GCE13796.1 ABC transporter ATP-binding protein [Tengunoibacter tsumagoiensis]